MNKGKAVVDNGKTRTVKKRKQIHYSSAKELLEADLPPVEYIVDVIISTIMLLAKCDGKL